MQKLYVLLLPVLLLGTFAMTAFAQPEALLVDVRTEQEWKEGHLQGAVLIPFEKITEGVAAAGANNKTRITLYCRSGRRTGIALDQLKKAGYENVVNLGTIQNAAKELNRPVVR